MSLFRDARKTLRDLNAVGLTCDETSFGKGPPTGLSPFRRQDRGGPRRGPLQRQRLKPFG